MLAGFSPRFLLHVEKLFSIVTASQPVRPQRRDDCRNDVFHKLLLPFWTEQSLQWCGNRERF